MGLGAASVWMRSFMLILPGAARRGQDGGASQGRRTVLLEVGGRLGSGLGGRIDGQQRGAGPGQQDGATEPSLERLARGRQARGEAQGSRPEVVGIAQLAGQGGQGGAVEPVAQGVRQAGHRLDRRGSCVARRWRGTPGRTRRRPPPWRAVRPR